MKFPALMAVVCLVALPGEWARPPAFFDPDTMVGDTWAAETRAADLRLEWLVKGRAVRTIPAVQGKAGETVQLEYRLRNVGGRDAFAAMIEVRTALGRLGRSIRLQPGPKAGQGFDRSIDVPLATGMSELCVDVRLQNLQLQDPNDPNVEDNRICVRIRVRD